VRDVSTIMAVEREAICEDIVDEAKIKNTRVALQYLRPTTRQTTRQPRLRLKTLRLIFSKPNSMRDAGSRRSQRVFNPSRARIARLARQRTKHLRRRRRHHLLPRER
jgi:hypothetical protein